MGVFGSIGPHRFGCIKPRLTPKFSSQPFFASQKAKLPKENSF